MKYHTVTYCILGGALQFVSVVLSTVLSKHDQAHDAAQSQSQLQRWEDHVARPAPNSTS